MCMQQFLFLLLVVIVAAYLAMSCYTLYSFKTGLCCQTCLCSLFHVFLCLLTTLHFYYHSIPHHMYLKYSVNVDLYQRNMQHACLISRCNIVDHLVPQSLLIGTIETGCLCSRIIQQDKLEPQFQRAEGTVYFYCVCHSLMHGEQQLLKYK